MINKSFSIIVCQDLNRGIGRSESNSIPWYIPADLKHFIELTSQKPIINDVFNLQIGTIN